MQVEVTKYTEGKADRETRPNALPVSLIKYDGKQALIMSYCPRERSGRDATVLFFVA